jgi:hypothetical protein
MSSAFGGWLWLCEAHPYERKVPTGALIPRWYCPKARRTFSLLPDCLASRLPGALVDLETVVRSVEKARTPPTRSWEAIAAELRPDIEVQGALRWLRRRLASVQAGVRATMGLFPDVFAGCAPTITSLAARLEVPCVLVALRGIAAGMLDHLPPSLGFGPRPARRWRNAKALQQDSGADPPPQASVDLGRSQIASPH